MEHKKSRVLDLYWTFEVEFLLFLPANWDSGELSWLYYLYNNNNDNDNTSLIEFLWTTCKGVSAS